MKKVKALFSLKVNSNRVFGLDIVRSVAILMVLLSHSRHLLKPFEHSLEFLSIGGFMGVELFFVLSGFLIGGIIIKIYNNSDRFTFFEIKDFWIRRWMRTLPNYYLALILNIIVFGIVSANFLFNYRFLFFLQSFYRSQPVFFNESWSLAVEEWFYLLLPLTVFLFGAVVARRSKKNKILFSIICFFTLVFIMRSLYVLKYPSYNWDSDIRRVTVLRLDSIFFGVLAAYFHFYYKQAWVRNKRLLMILGVALLAFSIFYFYNYILGSAGKGNRLISIFSGTVYFSIVNLSFACFLPYFNGIQKSTAAPAISNFVTHTSLISYSLYLYHFGIFINLLTVYLAPSGLSSSIAAYFTFWIGIYLFCTLIYKYFESPFTNLREYFTKDEKVETVISRRA